MNNICKECNEPVIDIYQLKKFKFFGKESNLIVKTIDIQLCESCILNFFNSDKEINKISLLEYLESLKASFDNEYNEVYSGTILYEMNSARYTLLSQIIAKIEGM